MAKKEADAPDLWAEFAANASPVSTEQFSDEEKTQIRVILQQFKVTIVHEFNPTEAQLSQITEKLDHLSESVNRLNRFDWSGVAIQTIIGIAVELALDQPKRQLLFSLFRQAFRAVQLLLQ